MEYQGLEAEATVANRRHNRSGGNRQLDRSCFLDILGSMRNRFKKIPLSLLVVICLTLGLAPFTPEPHLLEKLKMLVSGELGRPVDIFDLMMHGAPWVLLILKLYFLTTKSKGEIPIEDE